MKRARVKPVSDRRQSEKVEYDALRERLLSPYWVDGCEYQPKCGAEFSSSCTFVATELHHLRKRSSAGALCNPANVRTVCHECNMDIEDRPEAAEAAGLVVREVHPEWEALSARAWRKAHG